jgi:nicotinate phosphoribosyltransferase
MKESDRRTAEGALLTDLYQFTMAQLYFRMGMHERRVQFDHFFRDLPEYDGHMAGYCVNAGLAWLLDWIEEVEFREEDIALLASQTGRTGERIFKDDFLTWLKAQANFRDLTIMAIAEGRVVHPHVPLTVVQGPLAMAQILETPLLNQMNYQTLIATKAARIHESAQGGQVLEFGLRRGPEHGANAGGRGALIGGAGFSSNVGLSYALGLMPKGTHAHSMVQMFMTLGGGELEAFRAYAEIYPDDCLLLVDTVDTLQSGVPNAIKVFEELRAGGHDPVGIRLDSGDLAFLSIQAALMLDKAGFENTSIVLSNNLDEMVIWQIVTQVRSEAPNYGVDPDKLISRLVYGVGTRLITSWGEPALGGVYKLVAVEEGGEWQPAIKLSESPSKIPNPGPKAVWRVYDSRGNATADWLSLEDEDPTEMAAVELIHPMDRTRRRTLAREDISGAERLLETVQEGGRRLVDSPDLDSMRRLRQADVDRLDPGVRRLLNPHIYHVSLSRRLSNLKRSLIKGAVGSDAQDARSN